eukprot:SAG22_NODE_338_length_12038_cov_24.655583_5_plen_462_part_00
MRACVRACLPLVANQLAEKVAGNEAYDPPAELRLRTAGAHSKRSKEHSKEGEYDFAVNDLIRALLRKGLEEDVKSKMERMIHDALRGLTSQRSQEAKDAKAAQKAEQRLQGETEALAEAGVRRELDEQDWLAFEQLIKAESATPATDADASEALAQVELTLTKEANQQKVQSQASATVLPGQDASEAAFQFCAANDLHSADEVKKISGMLQQRLGADFEVAGKVVGDAAGHIARGKQHQTAGQYHDAGSEFSRALAATDGTEEQRAEASQLTVAMLRLQANLRPFVQHFLEHKWDEAVKLLEKVPREDRAVARTMLMEARCYQQLGRYANAQRAAARVLEVGASYGSWQRGEPRMMAVTLGADAAMEQGNSDKALKFYKTVLKFDPDQKDVRKQYKKLKAVVKLLEQAEKHVTKGYNHKAVETLDELLAELRGMDVDSNVFRYAPAPWLGYSGHFATVPAD